MPAEPIVRLERLSKTYPLRSGAFSGERVTVKAVVDVSLDIARGEVLGLVGESGSGKSTIGKMITRLIAPTSGTIRYEGDEIAGLDRKTSQRLHRKLQIIFQDPFSSLNPRMRVGDILIEGMEIHGILATRAARLDKAADLLETVGLLRSHVDRFPHEFSGGQRQRISIARALSVDPEFIVADEAVSALDVSVQAQVINLLQQLQRDQNLTLLFIAHDLAVVRHIADRIAVMYLGRIMEIAPTDALFCAPHHPYTAALISAVPDIDATRKSAPVRLTGDIPSPVAPPSGCVFRTRCQHAISACATQVPELRTVANGHFKACIRDDIL